MPVDAADAAEHCEPALTLLSPLTSGSVEVPGRDDAGAPLPAAVRQAEVDAYGPVHKQLRPSRGELHANGRHRGQSHTEVPFKEPDTESFIHSL